MKKNTIIYLLVFLVLAVTATVLILKKSESTLPKALTDFEVNDTASITKLHLTDHFKDDITLERKGTGAWLVNGKYKVQPNQIELLLETIKEVTVKNPVPLAARDNMIKDLAVNAIKIDIYNKDGLIKSYYVGSSTADDEGTIMMIQGSAEPFVTHIPGFVGYLTVRYITKEQDWRSTEIYHLNPAEIREVRIQYTVDPSQSFILKATENDYLIYKDPAGQPVKVNQLLAKKYLVGYRGINFEAFPQLKPAEKDSIMKTTPYAVINVATATQKMPPLRLYPKAADIKTKDVGKENEDLNRFYAISGDSKDILLMQMYLVGKLLATYNDLATGKANPAR
jgi:hypothetical protein